MRTYLVLPVLLAASAGLAGAQRSDARIVQRPVARIISADPTPKAVIGITTTSSATARDTLGVLVTSVTSGSPADRAGIEEGSRISSINNVSLRLASADVGAPEMSGAMSRRLVRELDKLQPGADVELRVYSSGQTRTVRVKTVATETLYPTRTATSVARRLDERGTLGLSIGSTGSRRDTLGVFVMSVDDNGPAAKAGIEEGARIAAINNVDLRQSREDAGDASLATSKVRRLQREIAALKPGDAAELRVYANGQTRTVRVTAMKMSDLPSRGRAITIFGGDTFVTPVIPPISIEVDGERIGETVRRALERARVETGRGMEEAGRGMEEASRALESIGRELRQERVRWLNDSEVELLPSREPLTVVPSVVRPVTVIRM